MRTILSVLLLLALAGCAATSPPVAEHYSGPTATIKDSVVPYSSSKADFFYLVKIDGKDIDNSVSATRMKNAGRGLSSMKPVLLDRAVPAVPAVFKITGRTEYSAPIQALTGTVYEVSGELNFSPEQDKVYVVRGDLGKNYSAVWIEEEDTHKVIGNKFEIKSESKANASGQAAEELVALPEKRTNFKAGQTYPYEIAVALPHDSRPNFAANSVAGTDWTGCKFDSIWGSSAPKVIQERLASELADSNLFKKVSLSTATDLPSDFHLKTDIHAFCGDIRKMFIISRAAGIVAIEFTVERNGKVVWQRTIEKVLTDDDPEYSGSQITTFRNATIHIMGDSLRLTLKDFFPALQTAIGNIP